MHRKYWIVAVFLYVVFLGVSLYGLMIHFQPRQSQPPEVQPDAEHGELITYHVTFKCGHYFTHAPQDGVAGVLRFLGLDEELVIWDETPLATSATGTLRQGQVNQLCRECLSKFFAGVQDGYVAIYYGDPRPNAELKELTKVRIDLLPEDFQVELKKGIPIKDDYNLKLFMENIES